MMKLLLNARIAYDTVGLPVIRHGASVLDKGLAGECLAQPKFLITDYKISMKICLKL